LEHEGHMVTFLLDIVEVPESHTGVALANAFQAMLERSGLENKVRVSRFIITISDNRLTRYYLSMPTMPARMTRKLLHLP